EEKLLDQQYKEEQERKKKRRKVWLTASIATLIIIATFAGFGAKYGFNYVKDTILGDESMDLLEGNWVYSEYGVPPIMISTPKVLERQKVEIPDEMKDRLSVTNFKFDSEKTGIKIQVETTVITLTKEDQENAAANDDAKAQELLAASERYIESLETRGAKDITVKREQFITPNAAEGLKTFGSMNFEVDGDLVPANYVNILFKAESVRQEVIVQWRDNDDYADEIIERILNSVELKKAEE
ncbi:MAG: hypothetical protein HRU26_16275, partial [Psychroserpens sp.]|nr:hypothetical protein [Psychroserpens sp.]